MRELGRYQRSVSIVGVGCTPWMRILDDPETEGLTENELFGYAALEAMKDAGVEGKDIGFYYHGQAMPFFSSDYMTANVQVGDWFGMRGVGSLAQSEACCTGYMALDAAVTAVASGKHDIVLSGTVDMGDTRYIPGKPAYMRHRLSSEDFMPTVNFIFDRAYGRTVGAGRFIGFDTFSADYIQRYGVTADQIDEAYIYAALANRKNAVQNPLALHRVPFEEVAKEEGFDDVMEYMKSYYNPKLSEYLRASGCEERCEGAAAVIVCPTEMAKDLVDKPIEVLGTGNGVYNAIHPHYEMQATERACRQVYDVTGVTPDEIDLFLTNDFIIQSQLLSAEAAGFLPKGEGWKYFGEGRTAYDGDRPINTSGGRTSFGHAHGASGTADVYEAVKQLRGEAGDHQVANDPKTAFIRGFGGGQNVATSILRAV